MYTPLTSATLSSPQPLQNPNQLVSQQQIMLQQQALMVKASRGEISAAQAQAEIQKLVAQLPSGKPPAPTPTSSPKDSFEAGPTGKPLVTLDPPDQLRVEGPRARPVHFKELDQGGGGSKPGAIGGNDGGGYN